MDKLPDRTFHSFRTSQSVDQSISSCSEMSIDKFRGSETVNCSVGLDASMDSTS